MDPLDVKKFQTVSESTKAVFQWFIDAPPDYPFLALLRPSDLGRSICLVYHLHQGTQSQDRRRIVDLFVCFAKALEKCGLPVDHDMVQVSAGLVDCESE
jgi:hypothetical protein